jgi:hypothetical protein
MAEARWEWRLPGGERVAATLDRESGVESVLVGDRLASQCPRGAKPEGHLALPSKATVTFDPRVLVCVLRIDGEEIAPATWPVPERRAERAPPSRSLPSALVLVVAALVVGVVALLVLRVTRVPARASGEMTGVHRAESGLFVAHFPPAFAARPAVVPHGTSGLALVDDDHADAVVIVAVASPDATRDVWLLQKRFHGEALANVPRADGRYEELARRDDTCLGLAGAVVVGRITNRSGEPAHVWSCAVTRGDVGYLVMSSLRESASVDDERRVRRVVDATELTRLGEVGAK